MSDLLLTHGYFLYEDPKELQILKPYVPLGLLYICSHLRQRGFGVNVFDSTFSRREDLFTYLHTAPPSVLGIYANLMTRTNVVEILRVAKESGWTTVVGGPEPGAYVTEYLDHRADFVVLGEGEITLEELLPAITSGNKAELLRVNGIAFRDSSGQIHSTPARAQIHDLDQQPWPARDAVDMDQYLQTWRQAHGKGSVSIITARGCPYRCRWCSHQVFGMTHRRRKPELVVDEVEWLVEQYSPEMIWIADDVFTINHGWLKTYAAEMKRRGLHIPFECISRADRMTEEVADLLAELGCFRLWIGSESGSQRVLDRMERGVSVGQVQSAVQMCRTRGIQSGMFLMWGYEGEELTDIEETIAHVKRSNPDVFFTTLAYPIKGTTYHSEVRERVRNDKPWAETSDRESTVTERAPRRVYEIADRLLRDEVDLARQSSTGKVPRELQSRIDESRRQLHAAVEVSA
ncbi:MAG TPA: radical SAM protein [Terriglobales bacterium]|nr:radical SAM protein [Terriglobales bacterium]